MKTAIIPSAVILGLEGREVGVEVDVAHGLPKFIVVGLPDTAVQEARERVRAAVKNSGFPFPMTRVTVNLAPAHVRKEGSLYDLPIALGIIAAGGLIETLPSQALFIGELSLEGKLREICGVLSVALLARKQGYKELFVPWQNASEAALVSGLTVYPCHYFLEVVDHIAGRKKMTRFFGVIEETRPPSSSVYDLAFVRGQEQAKRALVIAAAGGHNLLMNGAPGSGKTMLARSITSLLPPLSDPEALEVTQLYSVAGQLTSDKPFIKTRPFRHPHHTASAVALCGGGPYAKPGEISLAHRGVLFLDEFPEYPRSVLEVLRQPLEDGEITVCRIASTYTFPAKFILIAAQNPCPCGYFGDADQECTCSPHQLLLYRKKVSGPLLDRIDLHLNVPKLPFEKIIKPAEKERVNEWRKQVQTAREIQLSRFHDGSFSVVVNADMTARQVEKFCRIDPASSGLLRQAVDKLKLSARAYHRILKVSRTIADLEQKEKIASVHIAEALQYRER